MNTSNIICIDFESTSKNPHRAQPIQIAAAVIDPRKLSIVGRMDSYIRPSYDEEFCKTYKLDILSEEVLLKTKLDKKKIDDAPDIKTVWKLLTEFVAQHNYKKSKWGAPIFAGHNVHYDLVITNRVCGEEPYKLGNWDEDNKCNTLFNPIFTIDTMLLSFYWLESFPDIKSFGLDALRSFWGLENTAAHNAIYDVEQTTEVIIRYLKLARHYANKVKFEGSMKDWKCEYKG